MRSKSLAALFSMGALALSLAGCGPTALAPGDAPGQVRQTEVASQGGDSHGGNAAHSADDGHGHGADDGHGHGADDGHGHGAEPAKSGDAAQAGKETPSGDRPHVILETSMGNIEVELRPDAAPGTVKNFLEYVRKGHYANTVFHRIIPTFMIQGGGFTADGNEKPTGPGIKNEAEAAFKKGLKNERGALAMARTPDPHSASAQFFINTVDNEFLNYPGQDGFGYTVFGKVVNGMDVVDKIKAVPTGSSPMPDWPTDPPTIKAARVK